MIKLSLWLGLCSVSNSVGSFDLLAHNLPTYEDIR